MLSECMGDIKMTALTVKTLTRASAEICVAGEAKPILTKLRFQTGGRMS